MIRFYQLIYKKYFHQHIDILKDLEASCLLDPTEDPFARALAGQRRIMNEVFRSSWR